MIECVWIIMKNQLSAEPQLLVNRMLDQMIMCAIYGVCKVQPGMQIQFNNIITKYNELSKNARSAMNVYMHVYFSAETDRKDIIHFYNDIYIKTMKEYIIAMKPPSVSANLQGGQASKTPVLNKQGLLTPQLSKPHIKALCPPSPLKQNLPPPSMQYNTIFSSGNLRASHQTPLVGKGILQSPMVTMTPKTY